MAPPFIALTINEFAGLVDEWEQRARRRIDEVHMHHTWRPNHAQYRGPDTIAGMWRTHTRDNGWSDIAQHVSIAPDGQIWTGRNWDMPPASSNGRNGTPELGPFMFEMIGDFDAGKDVFQDPQRNAALWVSAIVLKAFGLGVGALKFHRELGSPKTCPGTAIDHGEIAVAVGKLLTAPLPAAPATRTVGSYNALAEARKALGAPLGRPELPDAEPEESYGAAYDDVVPLAAARGSGAAADDGLDPATLTRLRPHLIDLTAGKLSAGGRFQSSVADVDRIFEVEIPRRLAALAPNARLPLLLYAHGGLVSETQGLQIAAGQVPWWLANGVYPLHFVWETGLWEELRGIIGIKRELDRGLFDKAKQVFDAAADRAVEIAVAGLGGRLWKAMKYDAAAAFAPGGGGTLVIDRLAKLLAAHPGRITLHAVGHSAGSIFHSHALPALAAAAPKAKVATLSLLAPAITAADYKTRLDPLIGKTVSATAMFAMARDYERADNVAGVYGKSLLYLLMHAIEPCRPEPILGLDECLRGDPALRRRFGLDGKPGDAEVVFAKSWSTTGRCASTSTSHGGFDNDAPTMESVLRRILDVADAVPLAMRFPVDTVARDAPPLAAMAASAPDPQPRAEAAAPVAAPGARRALCIGIDDYPDPRAQLHGCVADAEAWAAALGSQGFAVEKLYNAAASRANILDRFKAMLGAAAAGDSLVLQYAGHGTQVADTDGDETDNEDEAFCPVDYADGKLIIDDDLRGIIRGLPPGVALTCFFDSCHSGTITRMAIGRSDLPDDALPRYIVLAPETVARHRQFRAAQGNPRGLPVDRDTMREVVFSACLPEEVALETAGRGAFSYRAVPLLATAVGHSHRAFADSVTAAFGDGARQHPNLDCATVSEALPLFGTAPPPPGREAPASSVDAAVAELLRRAVTMLTRQQA